MNEVQVHNTQDKSMSGARYRVHAHHFVLFFVLFCLKDKVLVHSPGDLDLAM